MTRLAAAAVILMVAILSSCATVVVLSWRETVEPTPGSLVLRRTQPVAHHPPPHPPHLPPSLESPLHSPQDGSRPPEPTDEDQSVTLPPPLRLQPHRTRDPPTTTQAASAVSRLRTAAKSRVRPRTATTVSPEDAALLHELAASPDAKFDIVYTWVNGSDPKHTRDRVKFGGSSFATDRDSDRNELLYSLRSLDQYMPWWQGTLFLVAQHLPCWLDASHPRFKWIRHEDIFLWHNLTLPTFNSDSIEAFLHRIPGLSDRFVYMNDDVYLGRLAAPSDFFRDGKAVMYFDRAEVRGGRSEYEQALRWGGASHAAKMVHTKAELQDLYGQRTSKWIVFRLVRHAPIAMRRHGLEALWADFHGLLAESVRYRFRSSSSIAIALAHHIACLYMTPEECVESSLDKSMTDIDYYPVGSLRDSGVLDMLFRLLYQPPLFFCTNDVRSDTGVSSVQQIKRELFWVFDAVLPTIFPLTSQWEVRVASCHDLIQDKQVQL